MSAPSRIVGSGLVVDGVKYKLGNREVVNWIDAPIFTMNPEDGEDRDDVISLVVLHTTTGRMPQILKPGAGPVGDLAERNARYWKTGKDKNGDLAVACAQLVNDFDGSWVQIADLKKKIAYNAGSRPVNHKSIGIENCIHENGSMWQSEMDSMIEMLDFITRLFRIPREYNSGLWPVPGIEKFRGVIGHRDVGDRGVGDPGPVVYAALAAAGYRGLNVPAGEHLQVWRQRQTWINEELAKLGLPLIPVDGDPGPKTFAASERLGKKHGQWTPRPSDALPLVTA